MAKLSQVQKRTKPTQIKRKQPRYSEDEKIAAVSTLLAHGGLTVEAINLVRTLLNSNVSTDTLATWLHQFKDRVIAANKALIPKPVDDVATIEKARQETDKLVDGIMHQLLASVKNTPLDNEKLRDKVVSWAVLFDKRRIMSGLSVVVERASREVRSLCDSDEEYEAYMHDFAEAIRQSKFRPIDPSADVIIEQPK